MAVLRLPTPDAFSDPATLGALIGPLSRVDEESLATPGYSGSRHTRLIATLVNGTRRSLILKRTTLNANWVARFSNDHRSREEAWLHEPALADVSHAFEIPYLASERVDDEHALLMPDLSTSLLPDLREPLSRDAEDALLEALAAMHARFWESSELPLPLIASFEDFLDLLGPARAIHAASLALLPGSMAERVADGWAAALEMLPRRASDALTRPAAELVRSFGRLPRTLIHGDAKMANFARLSNGRVAAFDWSLIAHAPASVDAGWYIAVNATRLAGSKDACLARYRELLEAHLGRPLEGALWHRLRASAIVTGARMLLWSKAWALRTGGDRERSEWAWWATELEQWAG